MSFLRFPGTAGSYISTPDVNILDADTSHLEQSQGMWLGQLEGNMTWVPGAGFIGSNSITVTSTASGWNQISLNPTGYSEGLPAVSGSTLYSVAHYVENLSASADVEMGATWWDSGGDFISDAVPGTQAWPSGKGWITEQFTSPANAASMGVWIRTASAGVGEEWWLGGSIICEGTDSTFVPSLRIVGLSSVVVDPADMQWSYTVGDEFQIGDGWEGDGISLVTRDGPGGPIVAQFKVPDIGDVGAVPPGTQWQDITGRTWTSSGSLEILDWLYGYPVEDLAAYLDAALPDGVQVYSHAADIGKLPAVVLVPGNPAIALTTMAGAEMTLAWGIEATLVVNRSQPLYGTRLLVDLWRQIATACIAYSETVQVLTLEEIGTVEWSGGEAMAGTMPLILTQSEGT